MASFGEPFSSLLVVLLALLAINPSSARLTISTDATTHDLSGDICTGTLEPALCSQVIKEIPRAAQATSLESLGQAAIPFAHSKGIQDRSYVLSLAGSATDPRLKENYTSCAENYDNAVGDLEESQDMFKSKDYVGVSTRASACMDEVETCQDNFKAKADPSELPGKNKEFNMLCVIVLRVANKLGGLA